MKKVKKLILLLAFCFINASVIAQVTATANASATIISPIAISKTADMNFGNVAVSTALGTVVLAPAGTRSATGGVTLPATTGTVTAAAFNVTGTTGYTFSITLPAGDITIDDNASHTMTVGTFTSTPTPTGLLTGGSATLNVGATLSVGASQVAGVYSSDTPFDIIVNYN